MLTLDIDKTVPSSEEYVRLIEEHVMQAVEEQLRTLVPEEDPNAQAIRERVIYRTRLIIEEVIVDHMVHGNDDRNGESGKKVRIIAKIDNGEFHWISSDDGDGFDPASVVGPESSEYVLETDHGKGIVLSRIMAELQGGYFHHPNGDEERPIGSLVETRFPLYDPEKYQHEIPQYEDGQ